MSSVTARVKEVKQPRGGYIKASDFDQVIYHDNLSLNENENIPANLIGMAVDYLTRSYMRGSTNSAFDISLTGAEIAEECGQKGSVKAAEKLLRHIKGLDDRSIICACKLVTFDVWLRNVFAALNTNTTYKDIDPDKETIENVKTLVTRGVSFLRSYGKMKADGFDFAPPGGDIKDHEKMIKTGKGTYGGYTPTVEAGDGDFLIGDTLLDFKVSVDKPTSKHTLQLLMYWIMGQHSGQSIFADIQKIGIFNPRLNTLFVYDMSKVHSEIIETVEREVIGYK